MFDRLTPRGASELIVESPRHDDTLATMAPEALETWLWMYRDRLVDLKRDGQIRDILVSRRHKKPGVPPHHPYSRVSAIPIVFDERRRELREAREYYQYKRRCLYCDMLRQEIAAEERVVRLTPAFAALVPYAPRGPLETWVLPRQHGCSFEEGLTAETARELARLLSDYFRTLASGVGDPGYEMVLHTAPNLRSRILQGDWATIRDDYHWHLEVVVQPEHVNRVGGIFVNETPPEVSAARQPKVARLCEDLRVRAGFGAAESRVAPGVGDVSLELADVGPLRVEDAPLDVAHPNDHAALAPEQASRDAADVAEPLDDDALPAERLKVARRLVEGVDDAAARGFPPPSGAADDERLAGDDARDGLALSHRVGVHHPRHRLLIGAEVRRRDVVIGADHEHDLGGIASREVLPLGHRHCPRVAPHASLGAPVR